MESTQPKNFTSLASWIKDIERDNIAIDKDSAVLLRSRLVFASALTSCAISCYFLNPLKFSLYNRNTLYGTSALSVALLCTYYLYHVKFDDSISTRKEEISKAMFQLWIQIQREIMIVKDNESAKTLPHADSTHSDENESAKAKELLQKHSRFVNKLSISDNPDGMTVIEWNPETIKNLLTTFKELFTLQISPNSSGVYPHINDDILALIAKQHRLFSLDLCSCNKYSAKGLKSLFNLELKTLKIDSSTEEVYSALAELANSNLKMTLEHLELGSGITDQYLAHLTHLQRLKKLIIKEADALTTEGIKHLAAIPTLRTLSFSAPDMRNMSACSWVQAFQEALTWEDAKQIIQPLLERGFTHIKTYDSKRTGILMPWEQFYKKNCDEISRIEMVR